MGNKHQAAAAAPIQSFSIQDVRCIEDSDQAIQVQFIRKEDSLFITNWIPKAEITSDSEVSAKGHNGTLCITYYLAELRGWK